MKIFFFFFFFQAEDGIRDSSVTGVQTCALPILASNVSRVNHARLAWLGKHSLKMSHLRCMSARVRGMKTLGVPKSPSHFGISYSRIRWSRKVFQVSSLVIL